VNAPTNINQFREQIRRGVNSDFEAGDDVEAPEFEAAKRQALRAALTIGADEICDGTPFFGAEVRVELDGELKQRFLIGIGQSPLK
jgi:hypothetical protein